MNESSHGVVLQGRSGSGWQGGAGVFLSLRREGFKETYNVVSLPDGKLMGSADLQGGSDGADWYPQFSLLKLSPGGR